MVDFRSAEGIGERVQAARKMRAMRSRLDLVERIGHASVTEPILANIEAGRKADLSVSQLLNIAFALNLSPLFLLAPMGDPARKLDLPNLSEDVAALNPRGLDAWVSAFSASPLTWGTVAEDSERNQLAALRELDHQLRERKRLAGVLVLEQSQPANASISADEAALWDDTEDRLSETEHRIEQLKTYLESAGWDLSDWK